MLVPHGVQHLKLALTTYTSVTSVPHGVQHLKLALTTYTSVMSVPHGVQHLKLTLASGTRDVQHCETDVSYRQVSVSVILSS